MNKRLLGSLIILIVSLIPVCDNILNATHGENFGIEIAKRFGYNNFFNFIWSVGASLSPILMFIAGRLKPYLPFYFALVFTYSADVFWILFTTEYNSYDLSYLYAGLFTIGLFLSIYFGRKVMAKEASRTKLIELLLDRKFKINK